MSRGNRGGANSRGGAQRAARARAAASTTAFDTLTVTATANGATSTLATFSNLNHITGYAQHTYALGSFAGKSVTLKFTGTEDASLQTSFVVDDTALTTG